MGEYVWNLFQASWPSKSKDMDGIIFESSTPPPPPKRPNPFLKKPRDFIRRWDVGVVDLREKVTKMMVGWPLKSETRLLFHTCFILPYLGRWFIYDSFWLIVCQVGWNHNLVSRMYVKVFQAEDPLVPQFWTLEVMGLGTLSQGWWNSFIGSYLEPKKRQA